MPQNDPGKARLVELDAKLEDALPGGKVVSVQFNPESLKLTFANEIRQNDAATEGGGEKSAAEQAHGTHGRQFVGAGTTRLAVQLWFDVNAVGEGQDRVDDVRRLTQEVIYFITPKEVPSNPGNFLPPGVRFSWGSFVFKGLIEGIEETIDYFSAEGKPLRATISLTMSQQSILVSTFKGSGRQPGRPPLPGTTPLTPAAAGSTLQGMAGGDWQRVAAANGIDNPRHLAPGQLLDLAARVPRPPS